MPEKEELERPESTGNPDDYIYVEDFTDIDRGKRIAISNFTMPLAADNAIVSWTHSEDHTALHENMPEY